MENNNFADFQLNRDQTGHDNHNHNHNEEAIQHEIPQAGMTASKVKVRCPQCFKLFSINAKNVSEPRPRFSCSSCTTQFWIPFPESLEQEELLGFPVSWLENRSEDISTHLKKSDSPELQAQLEEKLQVEGLACPKCGEKNEASASECRSCNVIIAQFKDQQEDLQAGFKTSKQLRTSWKTLIDDFDNPELHEDFIQKCKNEGALEYAVYRYGRVNKACPTDELSSAMLERLEKMVMTQAQPKTLEKTKIAMPQISSIVIGIGVLLMAGGYLWPTFRNIVGVGAAIVFLAIASRIYFRKS